MVPMKNNFEMMNNGSWLPRFWNQMFGDDMLSNMMDTRASMPAVNVSEDAKGYTVEVAVPGMTKSDCKVGLSDDTLTISVEKQTTNEQKDEERKYLRREFSQTSFSRSYVLPDDVDKTAISAQVSDGVLRISVPKKEKEEEEKSYKEIVIE